MCGKNLVDATVGKRVLGSPPRVREKLFEATIRPQKTRITPACAGKTPRPHLYPHPFWDHPRVCGKNLLFPMLQAGESGSPPRVREKLNRQGSGLEMSGITPACAGKTHPSIKRQQDFKDHPRVCGKNKIHQ